MKMILANIKMRNLCLLLVLFVLFLPNVFSQGYIDSRIDDLFLADENIDFNVRVHNPTQEIFEARLFVEIIGPESNREIFKEWLYLYPGDMYLKSFDDRLLSGDYKIRIELKDKFFESVLDQKILEFKVVNSCSAKNICSYDAAYGKCNCGKGSRFDNAMIVLFGIVTIGIFLVFCFETKRRRALG